MLPCGRLIPDSDAIYVLTLSCLLFKTFLYRHEYRHRIVSVMRNSSFAFSRFLPQTRLCLSTNPQIQLISAPSINSTSFTCKIQCSWQYNRGCCLKHVTFETKERQLSAPILASDERSPSAELTVRELLLSPGKLTHKLFCVRTGGGAAGESGLSMCQSCNDIVPRQATALKTQTPRTRAQKRECLNATHKHIMCVQTCTNSKCF